MVSGDSERERGKMKKEGDAQVRLQAVRARIARAAQRVGRHPDDITVIAVSKTVDLPEIRTAMDCGLRHFGENRVQEYLRKSAAFENETIHAESGQVESDQVESGQVESGQVEFDQVESDQVNPVTWHFIGRLQTNKVRQLAGKPLLLHSLDRPELLAEMKRISERTGCRWRALIEVNVSGEASKAGVRPEDLETLARAVSASGCVDLRGLMTVAPDEEDPEAVRACFRRLRELSVDIRSLKLDNVVMEHLSMGMSHDLEVAVEEGATMVRVGTALFGPRTYPEG